MINFQSTSAGILQLLTADNGSTRQFQIRMEFSGSISVVTFSPSLISHQVDNTKTFKDGLPHQLVVVFDDSLAIADGQIKCYMDGELLGKSTVAGRYSPSGYNLSPSIGSRSYSDGTEFKGIIDDCAIFYSALTLSEIQLLWNNRND